MDYYLVKYKEDWADEMSIYGHMVLNQEEYEAYISGLNELKDLEFYCGSNQEIYYSSNKKLKEDLEFIKITEDEADTLEKLGLTNVGEIPDDQIFELADESLLEKLD